MVDSVLTPSHGRKIISPKKAKTSNPQAFAAKQQKSMLFYQSKLAEIEEKNEKVRKNKKMPPTENYVTKGAKIVTSASKKETNASGSKSKREARYKFNWNPEPNAINPGNYEEISEIAHSEVMHSKDMGMHSSPADGALVTLNKKKVVTSDAGNQENHSEISEILPQVVVTIPGRLKISVDTNKDSNKRQILIKGLKSHENIDQGIGNLGLNLANQSEDPEAATPSATPDNPFDKNAGSLSSFTSPKNLISNTRSKKNGPKLPDATPESSYHPSNTYFFFT